tara:strand:- start:868 stop:1347 length:480 start_codon:yes stop_codon:yes gene_type:complete
MNTWELARHLVSICDSPDDVQYILAVLQDPEARSQLSDLLERFAGEPRQSPRHVPQSKQREIVARLSRDSNELVEMFRARGFKNSDVQDWLNQRLGINLPIGKLSLIEYLGRILQLGSPSAKNRIKSALTQDLGRESKSPLELEEYWDRLEGHSGARIE